MRGIIKNIREWKYKKREEKDYFTKGSLVHSLVLEPEKTDSEFVVADYTKIKTIMKVLAMVVFRIIFSLNICLQKNMKNFFMQQQYD